MLIDNKDEELWKPIDGFHNLYEISNKGRIRSCKIINAHKNDRGYIRIALSKEDGARRTYAVHRLVISSFISAAPCETSQVNHKDGNKDNNNIENLEWLTPAENIRHAFENNLCSRKKRRWVINLQNGIFYKNITDAAASIGKTGKYLRKYLSGERANNTNFIYI